MKNKRKIKFLNNSLLIDDVLVFGDFHIGYEEYLYGKYIPVRMQLKEVLREIEGIFELLRKEKIKEIVILGDLKHEFGEISVSEWKETLELLDFLLKKTEKIILIKGNHDNTLGFITRKKEVDLKDFYKKRDVCFMHGNRMFEECKDCKVLVLGHLHPSITLFDKYKKEKFKCFLVGEWKNKKVYVIPSFVPLVFGYDLLTMNEKKGFFVVDNKSLENFEVVVYNEKENKSYNFGKLKNIVDLKI